LNDIVLNKLKDYTLLFVENEKGIRENFAEFFNLLFREVFIAVDGVDGYDSYKQNKPDLIITDIKMPKMDGLELVKKIREDDKDVSIVIISAHTDVEFLLSSIPLNLIEYIVKPLSEEKLFTIFDIFLDNITLKPTLDFIYDKEKNQTKVNEEVYELSLKESIFLEKLLQNNRIISYCEIECDIWDGKEMSQNALRLFIRNFRKKLPKDFIKNISNQGYIINSNCYNT